MRRYKILIPLLIILAGCSRQEQPTAEPAAPEQPKAIVTQTVRYPEYKMTAINIEYPSTDPYGQPITLSGAITIGDEVMPGKPASGMLLYNHYTSFRADECPSRGDLNVQKMLVGGGLIVVSADYYGFGVTEDKPQAYSFANTNARASLDALVAAREILAGLGYTWADILFNAGYSQGGQVAMGVVKVASEEYPQIRFTNTFAGGGEYDMVATYRWLISAGEVPKPSAVVATLMAYNTLCNLEIPWEAIFKEPLLSHLDDWFNSKKYILKEIDALLGTKLMSDIVTPQIMDMESPISKKLIAAMEQENLCKGWTPVVNGQVTLTHNEADNLVPVENALNLVALYKENGIFIKSNIDNFGCLPYILPPHEMGGVQFFIDAGTTMSSTLGIKFWMDPTIILQLIK